ncbi:hypothetical protein ACQCN2_13300 [Brevibacillus ginsengisoli]|uniref:hypothetical protein n=1 Tax=Brevibacillus ginsengisoli TaxID=363854 RepID=UPI003CEE4C5B
MNEIKSYLYSKTNPANEVEHWEICLHRVKYNEFLCMAQERRSHQLIGWLNLSVDTELNGYFEMVKIINTGSREVFTEEPHVALSAYPS